ncbi:TPA: DNA-binding protein [Serratia marcescens]|nr:DNA-binding protein [Serratia marcescens]
MNILIFKPSLNDQQKNLEEFISFCKTQFYQQKRKYTWDNNYWKGLGVFIKLKSKYWETNNSMNDEFIDFAKAYILYQRCLTRKKTLKHEMLTLRIVEEALIKLTNSAHVKDCNYKVFDMAMSIVQKNYSESSSFRIGYYLEALSVFLSEKKLVSEFFIRWVNPLKRKEVEVFKPLSEIIGDNGKLSDLTSIEALASIFSKDDSLLSEIDLFVSSVFALLMCAPSRVSEILALPADCEITEQDKDGVEHYGLRFFSVKGYGADIKWIPTTMVPVAQKAVQRLRRISANARSIALWYEKKSSTVYRFDTCPDIDEDTPLTSVQVCQALGYDLNKKGDCVRKLKRLSLKSEEIFLHDDYSYTLNTLFKKIHDSPPPDSPYLDREKGIKYSNALCIINGNQFGNIRKVKFWEISVPSIYTVLHNIGVRKNTIPNIFERHGYFDSHGNPLSLHSHQARHLLDTFAHLGGLSDFDIARWSGRNDVYTNKYYNHVSEEHMKGYAIDISEQKQSTIEPFLGTDSGISVPNLDPDVHGAVLATEQGYCLHHYSIKPCSRFSGLDDTTGSGSTELTDLVDKLVYRTEQDKNDGVYGAEQWLELHLKYKEKLNKK